MIRALRRSLKIFWVAALLLACASTHAAASDPELGPSRRSAASPQSYEAAAGSGGLHRAGDVWVHVDNTNLSPGNFWYFQGLNQDPAAEWPGPSGTEYLVYSSLWIAGHDQLHGRRVDQGDEIRGDIAAFARTRHAYEGIAQGARGVDDDGDKSVDEEFLNGVDDDGDGKVDEDYAAISPDMFTSEMNDFTPQAIADATNIDQHHPLGLRVRRTSFAWTALGKRDFVGLHYEITNVTRQLEGGAGHGIDSLYLGMFWRPVAGARSTLSSSDDDFVGSARLASDGLNPPFAPQLARHVSKDEQNLNIFWTADNDGDGGQVGGAGAILLLGATRFPRLGLKPEFTAEDMSSDDIGNAPRSILPRSFHIYDPNLPYEQGGRPITDAQRYDALSRPANPSPTPEVAGAFRELFSVGPYVALPADSSLEFDIAVCVGGIDNDPAAAFPKGATDLAAFRRKFGDGVPRSLVHPNQRSLVGACQEAWQTWRGTWSANPRYDAMTQFVFPHSTNNSCLPSICDGNATFFSPTGDRGREACVLAPAGTPQGYEPVTYYDCHDDCGDGTLLPRSLSPTRCTWFDLDCDVSTGGCAACGNAVSCRNFRPQVDHRAWVATAPPAPPRTRIVAGNRQVEVKWDDQAEHISTGGAKVPSFVGYRLYRAAGWTRDAETGLSAPSNDLWQLVAKWQVGGEGEEALAGARDPAFPDSQLDLAEITSGCKADSCRVHPVGYYHYVDRQVVNGFRYFYSVTSYNEIPNPDPVVSLTPTVPQQSPRSGVDSTRVTPASGCETDASNVRVVPNPYRFRAAWDLRPSSEDPTGTHVNFNHLPCGRWTLRIFNLAGDLVATLHETDARGSGTAEWNLESRNGQDVKAGIYVYSLEWERGRWIGRFTVIR